jgi:DNA-binding response OmpR family regulator
MNSVLDGKRLLIVEDEDDLREPLVLEFESLGCKVYQAKNGRDGFDIVVNEKLDAVISDIRMPGGDGVELLKRIKANDHLFPVVMLITGFSDLSKEEAYQLGAEAILSKPFDLDEIGNAVTRILTPKGQKWSLKNPDQTIKLKIIKTFQSLQEAVKARKFEFGRGGFFIDHHDSLTGRDEPISFQIKFQSGSILNLEGSGVVRWVRKESTEVLPSGCGIEFDYLPDNVRQDILELTSSIIIIPYIPNGSKA